MSRGLPRLPERDRNFDQSRFRFGGMKRRKAAADGELYDLYNMTNEDYPALSVRRPRKTVYDGFTAVYGLGSAGDKLFFCADEGEGAAFYVNGEALFPVSDTKKHFARVGNYVTIWPDAQYYALHEVKNPDAPYSSLDDLVEATEDSRTLSDGDIYAVGETRPYRLFAYNSAGHFQKNRYYEGESFGYQTRWTYLMDEWGDLSASGAISGNGDDFALRKSDPAGPYDMLLDERRSPNLTFLRPNDVVRVTISYGTRGDIRLRKVYTTRLLSVRAYGAVSEYTFDASFSEAEEGNDAYSATVERYIPPLSHAFGHDNRLFGTYDGRLYASALGDPFNFLDFSPSASASYQVAVAGAEFTGAVSYGGYPTFFTENDIYRLAGAYPSEYRLLSTLSVAGVEKDASESLAIADGVLYYRSPTGVCAYTGSYPHLVSADISDLPEGEAAGGASGEGYYLCMEDAMLFYDVRYGTWHREDGAFSAFTRRGSALYAASGEAIVCLTDGEDEDETVESALEFAPLYDGHTGKKRLGELYVVLQSPKETEVRLSLSRAGGPYQTLALLSGEGRRTHTVPVPLSREDFYQIKLEGRGPWTLYALGRHLSYGTNRP